MAWYDSNYRFRRAITVDNSAGSAGAGKYVNVTIPVAWQDFWSNVQSTGYDMRVTLQDGVTLATFERATWTYASQVGTLEIGTITAPAAKPFTLWFYWGYSGAADVSTAVVPASPLTGYIDPLGPSGPFIFQWTPENYGDTAPRRRMQKGSAEEVDVWINFGAMLGQRDTAHQGQRIGQEIESVNVGISNAGGADQTGMYDLTKARILGSWVKIRLKGGTTALDYTVTVTVATTGDSFSPAQIGVFKFLVNVRDVIDQ